MGLCLGSSHTNLGQDICYFMSIDFLIIIWVPVPSSYLGFWESVLRLLISIGERTMLLLIWFGIYILLVRRSNLNLLSCSDFVLVN